MTEQTLPPVSEKKRLIALLLCNFLTGILGWHRFYVKKYFTGFLMFITFGGFFGIGVLFDMLAILTGRFRDHKGLPLKNWL
jgi:TM2 domain-containing membrane protein YozV